MDLLHFVVVFIFSCNVSPTVRAAPCDVQVLAGCMEGVDPSVFQGNFDPVNMDLTGICKMANCVENLQCELTSGVKELEPYCPSGGSAMQTGKPLDDPSTGVALQPPAAILFVLVLAFIDWGI